MKMEKKIKIFSKVGEITCQRKIKGFGANVVEVLLEDPIELQESETRFYSLKERLTESIKSPKVRVSNLMKEYKKYWSSNSRVKESEKEILKNRLLKIFVSDFMSLLNDIVDEIANGDKLSNLITVPEMSKNTKQALLKYSPIYSKAIIAEKATGVVPAKLYTQLNDIYLEFINSLKEDIFI